MINITFTYIVIMIFLDILSLNLMTEPKKNLMDNLLALETSLTSCAQMYLYVYVCKFLPNQILAF